MENSNQDPSIATSNNNFVGEQAQNTSSAPEAAPPTAPIKPYQQESIPEAAQPSITEVPAENIQSEQQPQTPPAPVLETSSLPPNLAASQQTEAAGSAMLQGNIPTKSSNLKIILIVLGVIILIAGGYLAYQYMNK